MAAAAATNGMPRQVQTLLFPGRSPVRQTLSWSRRTWRAWRAEPIRAYASNSRRTSPAGRMMRQALKTPSTTSPSVQQANSMKARGLMDSGMINVLLPGTFVRPPLRRFPREPTQFLGFLWAWVRTRVYDEAQATIFKFASKPRFLQRATWRRNRGAVVPEAKALHRSMSEAFAAGDKEALGRVCVRKLHGSLSATIEARPRGRRYGWELVRYNRPWTHPRVVDAKIMRLDQGTGAPPLVVHQVVVAIASRQRLVEYDDSPRGGGRVVPGSQKEVDLVENVVLTATVDFETFKQDEWRILSTIGETTWDGWRSEKQMMRAMTDSELQKYRV